MGTVDFFIGHFFDNEFIINLINTSISACWLVGAVLLFRLVFRKAPRWLIVALWAVVAVRLICPVPIESRLSLVPTAEPIPSELLTIDPTKGTERVTVEIIENPIYSGLVDSSVSVNPDIGFTAALADLLWLYGVGAMLIYALLSCLIIFFKVRQSVKLRDNIFLCDRIETPFIFGIIRPKIYLPSFMGEEDTEFVLAHEEAHLKRKDHLWKPLGFFILTVYWFNPVIWLSYILLCRDIELACDERVIKEMGADIKKPYSMALINCSVPKRMITACPVAFGETGVKKRIKAVLNYRKPALWLIIAAAVTGIILAVCFATSPETREGTLSEKNYLIQTDEGEEMFRFDEVIEYTESFTVYKGEKSYFRATPGNGRSTVLNLLSSLSLERLPDMTSEGLGQNGRIKAEGDKESVELIFCDGFSKAFMRSTGSSVESSLYAVDAEKVKTFFDEEKYLKQGNIWECNLASSAYGHGFIVFYADELMKLTEKPAAKGGRISDYTSEEHGDGYMWTPEITEDGVGSEASVSFRGTMYGEEISFTVNIEKVGQNDGLSTYYLISAEDTVIGGWGNGYEYILSKPVPSGENNEWYCNPMLSHTAYSCINFYLPTEYKLVSAECTKGTAEIENRYYGETDGEKLVRWHPDFDTYLTDESYEITVKALKKGEAVSFTVRVIGQDKADETGGRSFTLEFVDCIALSSGWAGYELRGTENTEADTIDKAVSKAVLEQNAAYKAFGECPAEGHLILGTEEKDGIVTVYMLEQYSVYGFEDGWFIEQSGHSVPAVMRFEKKDDQYIFLDAEYAEDGTNHIKSVRRMFPKIYEHRVTDPTDKDLEQLEAQKQAYAEAYLASIGREAPIGDYSDINAVLLTDLGVSVEVSNKLNELKVNYNTGKIGWFERIENGVRYVYRTSYAQGQNLIIYTKENYETKEITEKIEVDALTGNILSSFNSPAYRAYFDAEVTEKKDGCVRVRPFDGTRERKISEIIEVSFDNLDEAYLPDLYEGLYIRIYYDGEIETGKNAVINGASAIYLYADINYIGNQASPADEYTFDAEILDVYKDGKSILVEPLEGSNERKSADKILVSLGETELVGKTADYKKGMKVRIVYDGQIMETYPAEIRRVYALYLYGGDPEKESREYTTLSYSISEETDTGEN